MTHSERLLGTAGRQACEIGCLYCFTQVRDYKRCPRLDVLRTRDLVSKSLSSLVVQPACDTEFLLLPNWQDYLDELVSVGKIISFATKMNVEGPDLERLTQINKILMSNRKVLHVGVTIVRLREWQDLEPRAPSPDSRIAGLRRLWDAGIPTTAVIRPMIPLVSAGEIDEIVERTYRFCYGYLSGPLYLTPAIESYLRRKKQSFAVTERIAVWQEGHPKLRIVESLALEDHLRKAAEGKGRRMFANNVEAAIYSNDSCRRNETADGKWSGLLRREFVGTVYVVNPQTKEFLLMFHRKLGKWLAPGGHVEGGETPAQAALREATEELGVTVNLMALKGQLAEEGEDFRIAEIGSESDAFCTIEEFIRPIGTQDHHIHVDSVYVATVVSEKNAEKRDKNEVTAKDWFSLPAIEGLNTFDNVPAICRAILRAL